MSRNRKSITLEQKIKIIDEITTGTSYSNICRKYSLSKSTVSTVWKNREKIKGAFNSYISNFKRIRKPHNKDVDQMLFEWSKQKTSQNIPISGSVLQEKAEEFSKLLSPNKQASPCSKSWINRFKKRYCISSSNIQGESATAEISRNWLDTVWSEIRRGYSDDDIFNSDETGLFYKAVPNHTLNIQKEKCHRGEKSKERITIFVCANMTGTEKRKLLVIGKPKAPPCFKTCKVSPINYITNSKSWITSDIFEKEIRSWDSDLQKENRKIILMIDNCPAHPTIDNLNFIKLIFLPPNSTTNFQPMDQGITTCLKQNYKKIFLSKMITHSDNGMEFKFSLLDAILAINSAWKRVSQKTIINGYRRAGFYNSEFDQDDEIALTQKLHKINSEHVNDEDSLNLLDWAVKNNILNDSLNTDLLNAFEEVDSCLVTCEYPSEVEMAATVELSKTEIEEQSDISEDEVEEKEDIIELTSVQQVSSAMKVLSTYLEFNDFESDTRDNFDLIQKRLENSFLNKVSVQKEFTTVEEMNTVEPYLFVKIENIDNTNTSDFE